MNRKRCPWAGDDVRDEFGSFDAYVWRFVGGSPKAAGCTAFSSAR